MPLSYRDKGTSGTQLEVISGTLVIGSVRKEVLSAAAGQGMLWRWTLYVSAAPPGFQHHGMADTCDQAKAELESSWMMWVQAARLGE